MIRVEGLWEQSFYLEPLHVVLRVELTLRGLRPKQKQVLLGSPGSGVSCIFRIQSCNRGLNPETIALTWARALCKASMESRTYDTRTE